jgi:hypothetical protein
MEIKIPRAVKKGGVNINNGLPYNNMEESIKKYIDFGGNVFEQIGPNNITLNIIGKAISFDDETITVILNEYGKKIIYDNLSKIVICVNSNCDITDKYMDVHNLVSLSTSTKESCGILEG